MITAGTSPPVFIDLGSNGPGMTLQYRDLKNGFVVWRDVVEDGQAGRSPVDIDALPPGVYRLTAP